MLNALIGLQHHKVHTTEVFEWGGNAGCWWGEGAQAIELRCFE
jgi:hypothetical protein